MRLPRRALFALPALALPVPASAAVAKLDYRGRYLFVDVRLNGHPLAALLDSGAQMSVIDRAFAIALGIPTSGNVVLHGPMFGGGQGAVAKGVSIDVAGLTLKLQAAVVADLSSVGGTGGRVAMILGRDLFDAAVVAIDIGASTLAIRPPAAPRPGVRLPLTRQFGVETIPILIDGHPAHATFDLGNSGRMMVSAGFAARAGLLAADRAIGAVTVRTISGTAQRLMVQLHSVEIAGKRVPVAQAIVEQADNASDALIGIDVLRHFRLTCDFAHGAVWLDPVRR